MRKAIGFLLLISVLMLTASNATQTDKRAAPPTVDELAGAWIGFDGGGSEFVRIELQPNQTGYLAIVAAPNFITHDCGVQVYRVNAWRLNGWQISCDLSPISSNAESAQASGKLFVSSLYLKVHGDKRRWKIESTLHMEPRIDQSNKKERRYRVCAAQVICLQTQLEKYRGSTQSRSRAVTEQGTAFPTGAPAFQSLRRRTFLTRTRSRRA
jgi:hypothetical protein